MGGGYPQDGEGLWDVVFEPGCELRSRLLVAGHDVAEPPLGLGRLVGVEDAAKVAGDLRLYADLRHVCHGVLHEMELAPLPRHLGEDGLTGGLEPAVVVADDELDAPHASIVIRRAKTGHSSAPKTGHHVGGTRWKNRLIRFCWQGA